MANVLTQILEMVTGKPSEQALQDVLPPATTIESLIAAMPKRPAGTGQAPLVSTPLSEALPGTSALADATEKALTATGSANTLLGSSVEQLLDKAKVAPPAPSQNQVIQSDAGLLGFLPQGAATGTRSTKSKKGTAAKAPVSLPQEQFEQSSLLLPTILQLLGAAGSTAGIATGKGDIGSPFRQLGAGLQAQGIERDKLRLKQFEKKRNQAIALNAVRLVEDPKLKAILKAQANAGKSTEVLSTLASSRIKDQDRFKDLQTGILKDEIEKDQVLQQLQQLKQLELTNQVDISNPEQLAEQLLFITGDEIKAKKWSEIISENRGWWSGQDFNPTAPRGAGKQTFDVNQQKVALDRAIAKKKLQRGAK